MGNNNQYHVPLCVCLCVCLSMRVVTVHRLQILQVDVLVAEAVEAYNIGELQPEVTFNSALSARYFNVHTSLNTYLLKTFIIIVCIQCG